MEGPNLTLLISPAHSTKSNVAVFVTRNSVGGIAIVVWREVSNSASRLPSVFRKLPDVLIRNKHSGINDRVKQSFRTDTTSLLLWILFPAFVVVGSFHAFLQFTYPISEIFGDMVDAFLLSG